MQYMQYSRHFSSLETPQNERISGRSDQVRNSAKGYVWRVDDWKRLDRFLILGAEGGSYYASEQKLTIQNANALLRCLQADGVRTVQRIVEISEAGRAPKNAPAVFALTVAAGMGDPQTKQAALRAVPRVARYSTDFFQFLEEVQQFRGWGRGLRGAAGNWYVEKDVEALAYQLVKYRQRNGWTHRDVLRHAHPVAPTPEHEAIFRWATSQDFGLRRVARRERKDGPLETKEYAAVDRRNLPILIQVFEKLQAASSLEEVIELIRANRSVTWEMIPTEFLGQAGVWGALLPNMPPKALIRNLARMTANGLLKPLSKAALSISERLMDAESIRKARIHPIAVLGALAAYRQGHGVRGELAWEPVDQVVDALDKAFYLSFGNVQPTGKRFLLALDVSGSMSHSLVANMPGVTPCMGAAAMAMVAARTESNCQVMGFAHEFRSLGISARDSLTETMRKAQDRNFGGTDCSLPMRWALAKGLEVDTFVVYTDNETWAGGIHHPSQALEEYRRKTGIPAKLVVVGMVANGFTIADPEDAGMLDVVGFDTATPQLISDFASEE